MNKLFSKIAALSVGLTLAIGVGVAVGGNTAKGAKAEEEVVYTLDGTQTGGNNNYASASDITQDNILWKVVGNTTESPWRIGGKNISKTDRNVYSSSKLNYSITKVELKTGTATITVNGITLIVSENSDFSSPLDTINKSFSASSTITFEPTGSSWTNCYYKLTFNVTNSTNSNKYCQLSKLTFYEEKADPSTPEISLLPASLSFLEGGISQDVTVTPNDAFTNTPTISVDGTPSYVTTSVNGLKLTVSPKAIGEETLTVRATNGNQQATATLNVSVESSHGKTLDDPYTVAEAIAAIDASKGVTEVYTQGVVSEIVTPYSSQYSNISFNISTDGTATSDQLQAFRCVTSEAHSITSDDDIKVGATVVLYGNLTKYNSTYEYAAGCTVQKYTAPQLVLDSITLSGEYKTEFEVGDDFEFGGTVTANYVGGATDEVTESAEFKGYDMSTAGEQTVTVSYTEGEVTKTATYDITVIAPKARYAVTFLPGEGTGEMNPDEAIEGETYVLPVCTFKAPESKVFAGWQVGGQIVAQVENVSGPIQATATWRAVTAVTDDITLATTGASGTTYTEWSNKTVTSDAVYAGKNAGGNSAIQFNNSNQSGIVSTTSGGIISKVALVWNSNTTSGRTVDVYGSNTAYTSSSDLFDSSKSGTKLGSIVYGTSTELTITGDYAYVGLRSYSGALYLDKISITWLAAAKELSSISLDGEYTTTFEQNTEFKFEGDVIAHYVDESTKTVTSSATFSGYDLSKTGEQKVTVSYTESGITKTTSYDIEVIAPIVKYTVTFLPGEGGGTMDPVEVEAGTEYTLPTCTFTNPQGKHFAGWSLDGTNIVTSVLVDSAKTVTALWEENAKVNFKKVETELADYSGTYLIVFEDADSEEPSPVAFNGSLSTLDAANNGVSVEINNGVISLSEEYAFTVSKKEDGYSIRSASGLYIGNDSNSNALKTSANDDFDNSVNYNDGFDIAISSSHLRYNSTSGQLRFRYFKSASYAAQKAVALYMKVDAAESLGLDILNQTYDSCSAYVDGQSSYSEYKATLTGIWTNLKTTFDAITDESMISKLVNTKGDKNGLMFQEAMARYDFLTSKYVLDNFISERNVPVNANPYIALNVEETDNSMIIIVSIAATTAVAFAALLIIKKKKHN